MTLVAPDPDFLYKPLLVEEPFDLGPAEKRALAPLAEELGGRFVMKAAKSVRPDEHTVELDDGSTLDYDFLTGDESLHLRADVAGGGEGDEASLDCLCRAFARP